MSKIKTTMIALALVAGMGLSALPMNTYTASAVGISTYASTIADSDYDATTALLNSDDIATGKGWIDTFAGDMKSYISGYVWTEKEKIGALDVGVNTHYDIYMQRNSSYGVLVTASISYAVDQMSSHAGNYTDLMLGGVISTQEKILEDFERESSLNIELGKNYNDPFFDTSNCDAVYAQMITSKKVITTAIKDYVIALFQSTASSELADTEDYNNLVSGTVAEYTKLVEEMVTSKYSLATGSDFSSLATEGVTAIKNAATKAREFRNAITQLNDYVVGWEDASNTKAALATAIEDILKSSTGTEADGKVAGLKVDLLTAMKKDAHVILNQYVSGTTYHEDDTNTKNAYLVAYNGIAGADNGSSLTTYIADNRLSPILERAKTYVSGFYVATVNKNDTDMKNLIAAINTEINACESLQELLAFEDIEYLEAIESLDKAISVRDAIDKLLNGMNMLGIEQSEYYTQDMVETYVDENIITVLEELEYVDYSIVKGDYVAPIADTFDSKGDLIEGYDGWYACFSYTIPVHPLYNNGEELISVEAEIIINKAEPQKASGINKANEVLASTAQYGGAVLLNNFSPAGSLTIPANGVLKLTGTFNDNIEMVGYENALIINHTDSNLIVLEGINHNMPRAIVNGSYVRITADTGTQKDLAFAAIEALEYALKTQETNDRIAAITLVDYIKDTIGLGAISLANLYTIDELYEKVASIDVQATVAEHSKAVEENYPSSAMRLNTSKDINIRGLAVYANPNKSVYMTLTQQDSVLTKFSSAAEGVRAVTIDFEPVVEEAYIGSDLDFEMYVEFTLPAMFSNTYVDIYHESDKLSEPTYGNVAVGTNSKVYLSAEKFSSYTFIEVGTISSNSSSSSSSSGSSSSSSSGSGGVAHDPIYPDWYDPSGSSGTTTEPNLNTWPSLNPNTGR